MSITYSDDYKRLMENSFNRLERVRKLSVIASDYCHKKVMAHPKNCPNREPHDPVTCPHSIMDFDLLEEG